MGGRMINKKARNIIFGATAAVTLTLTGCSAGENPTDSTISVENSVVSSMNVSDNAEDGLKNKGEQLTPQKANDNGSFRVSQEDNLKEDSYRLDIFVDPACPACQMVEFELGEDLIEKANNGEIDYYITQLPFLDETTVGDYSLRASNAFVTIAEEENEVIAAQFMQKLYEPVFFASHGRSHEPRSDKQILELAETVGVKKETLEKIAELHYVDWLKENKDKLEKNKEIFPDGLTTPRTIMGLGTGNEQDVKFSGAIRGDFDMQEQQYKESM